MTISKVNINFKGQFQFQWQFQWQFKKIFTLDSNLYILASLLLPLFSKIYNPKKSILYAKSDKSYGFVFC